MRGTYSARINLSHGSTAWEESSSKQLTLVAQAGLETYQGCSSALCRRSLLWLMEVGLKSGVVVWRVFSRTTDQSGNRGCLMDGWADLMTSTLGPTTTQLIETKFIQKRILCLHVR